MKKLVFLLMLLPCLASATEAKDVLKTIRSQKREILVQTVLQTETLLEKNGFNAPPDLVFLLPDKQHSDPVNQRFDLSYYFYRPSKHTPAPGCIAGEETVAINIHLSAPYGDLSKPQVNNVEVSRYLKPDACPPGGISSGG